MQRVADFIFSSGKGDGMRWDGMGRDEMRRNGGGTRWEDDFLFVDCWVSDGRWNARGLSGAQNMGTRKGAWAVDFDAMARWRVVWCSVPMTYESPAVVSAEGSEKRRFQPG